MPPTISLSWLPPLLAQASERLIGNLGELAGGATVWLAVTGLSRSGKTVFITSLIHNLLSALHDPDRLLTESLRVDERRRRVRRLVRVNLFVGGILMGTTLIAVLAGWLAVAEPPNTAHKADSSHTRSARPLRTRPHDEDARIERAEELAAQGAGDEP